MKINDKEYTFKLTIGAVTEISTICPDGNIDRFGDIFEGSTIKMLTNLAKVAVAMNRYSGDENLLTVEDVMSLTYDEFQTLQTEILDTYRKGRKTTVKAVSTKKKAVRAES